MPARCVAANCGNTHKDGVSLFKFPDPEEDRERHHEWVRQVKRTREWTGPSKYSVLCSAHFTPDQFDSIPSLKRSLGITARNLLKSTAIPTIFIRNPQVQHPSTSDVNVKRRETTVQKLGQKRMLNKFVQDITASTSSHSATENPDEIVESLGSNQVCIEIQTDGISKMNRLVQTMPRCNANKTIAVQTDFSFLLSMRSTQGTQYKTSDFAGNISVDSDDENEIDRENDMDYEPDDDKISSEEEMDESICFYEMPTRSEEIMNTSEHKQEKFIIFWDMLTALLFWVRCTDCHSKMSYAAKKVGSLLVITFTCIELECSGKWIWNSQPYIGKFAAGNILLSAGILFSGNIAGKVLKALKHIRIAVPSERTFFNHQKYVLCPSIENIWKKEQLDNIGYLRTIDDPIVMGGDGRADSPGHSAKYGTYTMMSLNINTVIDLQLVASNEVRGSTNMEKEGFIRSIEYLNDWFHISKFISDRHLSIAKYIRDNLPAMTHLFDIWHVAKGVSRKLEATAKLKGCESIRPWIKSISNHLYWCAVSTPVGNGELIVAKWKSVLNHIQNIHHNHDDPLFQNCIHGDLEGRELQKHWIVPGSKALVKIEDIILSRYLLKDIKLLSGHEQTSTIEAFHSLLIQFAPKNYVFNYTGMKCRTMVAALHYNENSGRSQAETTEGEKMYKISFPKFKKGGHTVRKVMADPSYGYIDRLMQEITKISLQTAAERKNHAEATFEPLPLCANYNRPVLEEAIDQHRTRFHHNNLN